MKLIYCSLCCWLLLASSAEAQLDHPAPIEIPESEASSEKEMKPYSEVVEVKIINWSKKALDAPISPRGLRLPLEGQLGLLFEL